MQAFNPYLPSYEYVPDGEPRVFGDRVYIYGSHDQFNGDDFCPNDYVCWSADVHDLSDWKYEGVIYRKDQDPKNKDGKMTMCAPDVIQGTDGRYYLYYEFAILTVISVAVCDTPNGKFQFLGYIQKSDGTLLGEKKGEIYNFDPGIFVDDDGRVFLYSGFSPLPGFLKFTMGLRGLKLDGSYCIELESDMHTMKGEPKLVAPGHELAQGTKFEGHAFFEASSMRKIGDKYYFIYSSELSHELCYAVSDRPDGGFEFGGTLISIGDIGYEGRTNADNYTGNTHGSVIQIGEDWYVFYHRQTNKQKCCRQGCAEKIEINSDGNIPQVEMTSCGLNQGPLQGKGTYEARIASVLQSAEGTFPYLKIHEKDKKMIHPYFTQSGKDREENGDQYIANMTKGSMAGFKYFEFNHNTDISVSVRTNKPGIMEIRTAESGEKVAEISVEACASWQQFQVKNVELTGVKPLYFTWNGDAACDFNSFTLI